MSKNGTKKDWSKLVNGYRKSGQTQKAFAKLHGVSPTALQYHLRKDRLPSTSTSAPEGFIEVSPGSAGGPVEIEIVLSSGAAIRLRG